MSNSLQESLLSLALACLPFVILDPASCFNKQFF
jgi:hypothetical protein